MVQKCLVGTNLNERRKEFAKESTFLPHIVASLVNGKLFFEPYIEDRSLRYYKTKEMVRTRGGGGLNNRNRKL